MLLTRRNALKAGAAVAATVNLDWFNSSSTCVAETLELSSMIQVSSFGDPGFTSTLAEKFSAVSANPAVKPFLPASFIVTNLSTVPINSLGADLWIDSGNDQYCLPKFLQTKAGDASIHSARRPVLPANATLFVTPFFSLTEQMANASAIQISSKLFNGTAQKRFLLSNLSTATHVSLTVRAAVVNGTELVGSYRQHEMHSRVTQAAEHDLANRLRYMVNHGAQPTTIEDALKAFLSKYAYITTYLAMNRRIYIKAKLAYARVLLRILQNDPVSFLRDIKVATLQQRVNFTFVRRANGGEK